MLRTALLTSLVLLLGCGGQETSDAGRIAPTETPDTAAPAPSPVGSAPGAMKAETPAEVARPSAEVAPPSVEATVHPQVQGCLDLIGQGEFSQALPVCLEAARLDPGNTEVQAALAKAKTETAGLDAATGAATGAAKQAAEGAAGAAVPKLETPKPDMPKLPGASN